MELDKILRSGCFDTVRLIGAIQPIFETNGVEITSGESFIDNLNDSPESFRNGISKLRVQLVGEIFTNGDSGYSKSKREDLERWGVYKLPGNLKVDRYQIAYADILIVKGELAIPYNLKDKVMSADSMNKLFKTGDMVELLTAAIDVEEYIVANNKSPRDLANIAIVDKVYVHKLFRRCGISSWIHNNLADIINMFSMLFPVATVLLSGDFSGEAESEFNMTDKDYIKMLIKHYKSLGYNHIEKLHTKKYELTGIMYKLYI